MHQVSWDHCRWIDAQALARAAHLDGVNHLDILELARTGTFCHWPSNCWIDDKMRVLPDLKAPDPYTCQVTCKGPKSDNMQAVETTSADMLMQDYLEVLETDWPDHFKA